MLDRCKGTFSTALLLAALASSTAVLRAAEEKKNEVGPFAHAMHQLPPPSAYEEGEPPLFDTLGSLSWKVTTASPEAQAFFDQGLRLSYGFNHFEARRAFRKAARLDPGCAMCYWGEALVLGPNINVPMDPAASAPAVEAIGKAKQAAHHAPAKEQALIAALEKRYSADPGADRRVLDAAWAEALGSVARDYPDDLEIQTLRAEALMDLQPWDYWTDGGKTPKGQAGEIVATLEKVLAAKPDHVGAIHLYIHAVEASDRPERAEPGAERLAALMPGAGHIVHMPSHIYYRVGRYLDALEANRRAVATDEAYIAAIAPVGPYPLGYYPHNVHFLMAAAQMSGEDRTVLDAARKLQAIIPVEAANAIAIVQPVMAAPYFAHAQFATPEEVMKLELPAGAPPYVKAMWHYARGVAQAGLGRFEEAEQEATTIDGIARDGDFALLAGSGVPAKDILGIARDVVKGRVAAARGDLPAAISSYERAAAGQDGLPYMEPPFWYYPVHQSLGAARLLANQPDAAEKAFQEALTRKPNNGWAIYGLAETARARGDAAAESEARARLARTWTGDPTLLDLKRL